MTDRSPSHDLIWVVLLKNTSGSRSNARRTEPRDLWAQKLPNKRTTLDPILQPSPRFMPELTLAPWPSSFDEDQCIDCRDVPFAVLENCSNNNNEDGLMKFHVFRCKLDRDCFIVTDEDHAEKLTNEVCPSPGDELEGIGAFSEMGEDRAAFDEGLAKRSIEHQGYYLFHSKTFDPVAQPPIGMP